MLDRGSLFGPPSPFGDSSGGNSGPPIIRAVTVQGVSGGVGRLFQQLRPLVSLKGKKPFTITWTLYRNGVPLGNFDLYTGNANDDLARYTWTVRVQNALGEDFGQSEEFQMRYPPPVLYSPGTFNISGTAGDLFEIDLGSLADDGDPARSDAPSLVWRLAIGWNHIPGGSIDIRRYFGTLTTAAEDTETTLIGENSGGSVTVYGTANNIAAGDTVAPIITAAVLDGENLSVYASEAGRCFAMVTASPTATAAAIEAGTGSLVTATYVDIDADGGSSAFNTSSLANGNYYVHLVMRDLANNQSAVVSVPFDRVGAAVAWSITAGNGQATIVSRPIIPAAPAWNITPGNGQATIVSRPGFA